MQKTLVSKWRRAVATAALQPGLQPRPRQPTELWLTISRSVEDKHNSQQFRRPFAKATRDHMNHAIGTQTVAGEIKEDNTNWATDAPMGELCIVFTDIVDSTRIWENNPAAMTEAMQTHDNLIRDLVAVHDGYEVKQNGDGFMVAFSTALSALTFCLTVQQRLLDQKWPDSLIKIPPGREVSDEDGTVLFRGLQLRTSAHWGTPVCIWNNTIGRMDYLGPMVNRAARFIQATEGGQTVVSETFLQELQRSNREENPDILQESANDDPVIDLQDLHCRLNRDVCIDQNFEIRFLGEHKFKGVPEAQRLYFILPETLHGRLEYWPKHKHIPGSKGNIFPSSS